jgi:hypothetical protein
MLSVVVVPFGTSGECERCLGALVPQLERVAAEVIVPHDGSFTAPAAKLPGVRFIAHEGFRTPAALRAAGAAASRGDLIAFLETHCVPAPGWCESLLAAHRMPYAAVGGPIEKGMPPGRHVDSALNWSVYLSDFGRYMLPAAAGPRHSLSDCNVAYKRTVLAPLRSLWEDELHENVVNGALLKAGSTLWFDPGMVVLESRSVTLPEALRDRFAFGRLFGSTRVSGLSPAQRFALAGSLLFLPPILVWRVWRQSVKHRAQVTRAAGHLMLLSTVWLAGEAVGCLTGAPGRPFGQRASD